MKQKNKKGDFLECYKFSKNVITNINISLLGNLLTGKGTIRAGEGTIRAGQDFYYHLIV